MWQNILVALVLAAAAGFTLWRFYGSFSGKTSCCGGGCTCKGSCGGGGKTPLKVMETKGEQGMRLLSHGGCGCSHGAGG